jgi:hypothetical protein
MNGTPGRICSVEGCEQKHAAKGLCQHHYDKTRNKTSRESLRRRKIKIETANRDKSNQISREWVLAHPEYGSVALHYWSIFGSRQKNAVSYKGMPYFDGWNPKNGGSLKAGANWIRENLGPRPGSGKEYHLHIVNRAIGFMPGNLQWVPQAKHAQEELVNKLLLEVQNLRIENERLRSTYEE